VPPSPPGGHGVHDLGPPDHTREREAAGQALGDGDQVRHHAAVLDREPRAGARETRLDLVGDQEDAALVADPAQLTQELERRDVIAAFALHRLDDDGRDPLGLGIGAEQEIQRGQRVLDLDPVQRVRERGAIDVAREGAELVLVRADLAGQPQGHQGSPMVAARERDDARPAGRRAGDLDGVLDRLGAGGEEDGLLGEVAGGERVQPLGERNIGFIGYDLEARVGAGTLAAGGGGGGGR
jgi:ParB family chromosome partitioning protein